MSRNQTGNKMINENQIYEGQSVRYAPNHAKVDGLYLDLTHEHCEDGVITSWNDSFVFVRYGSKNQSQATKRENLFAC